MKVALHVDQLWFHVPGGIGTYVHELWTRLLALPDVDVVPFRSSFPSDRLAWTVPTTGGVRTGSHRIRYPLWDVLGWPPLPRTLAACDVIHATNQVAVPPARRGQALVVTVHDLAFERFPEAFPSRWRRLQRAGVRAAARRADAIVVPSRATADDLIGRHDVDPSRIHVTPLAAATPVTAADPAAALEAIGVQPPYVLSVGTLEPRKNTGRLIQAFRRIAGDVPHALVLAGSLGWGVDGLVADLADRGGRVVHVDAPGAEHLDALYQGADAFAYPSLSEGFGLPVLEAMLRGVPVVASTTPAVAETAGDAALLVDPSDADAIGDALRRVLTEPALADDLRARGRARASAFSWERTAAQTVEVYRAVAGRS
jgi:glycosyltransferase involved in cell wall biosynthesis